MLKTIKVIGIVISVIYVRFTTWGQVSVILVKLRMQYSRKIIEFLGRNVSVVFHNY